VSAVPAGDGSVLLAALVEMAPGHAEQGLGDAAPAARAFEVEDAP